MRRFWEIQLCVAAAGLVGLGTLGVACQGSVTKGTDTNTDTVTIPTGTGTECPGGGYCGDGVCDSACGETPTGCEFDCCEGSDTSCCAPTGGAGCPGGSLYLHPCQLCACDWPGSASGCRDACSGGLNGSPTPDFCDGWPASEACAACIAEHCGESDPADCH